MTFPIPLRPRASAHFFLVEPGAVLFCESSQNLYALNGAAAVVWCGLADGLGEQLIHDELIAAGAPTQDASAWYRQSMEMFRLRGLLEGTQPPDPPVAKLQLFGETGRIFGREMPKATGLFLQVFDSLMELRLGDRSLVQVMEEMFGRVVVAGDRPADVSLGAWKEGDRWILGKGELVIDVDSLTALASAVEQTVTYLAIEGTPFLLEFDVAVMEHRGAGFLLAGPPGGGKTTLAAGLMHRRWAFGSDDRALLRRDDPKAHTAPLSLCLKQGSWPVLAPLFPEIDASPARIRQKRPARYLLPRGNVVTETTIRHVIFPRFRTGAVASLTPVLRHEGLQRLFASCRSSQAALASSDIAWLVEWAGGIEFFALDFGELGDAADLLNSRF